MFHSSSQPKFYLIYPQVSFQHFNHSYFAAQDFAEQLFCKTSFTDCVWFIWRPFRWLRTWIYILITKYILCKWRNYFSCISFDVFWAYQRQGVTLSTSLFMFHLISFSPHFIDHVSFLFPSVHSPPHSFHLPQSISIIFTLFGCIHITWSFNLIVSFTFQPIRSLEINDLRVSLDKFLILDRCSLLEAELRWFYYSFSLYMKQEIQHRADLIWWLKTTLHPLIILAVKKLMSLRNMKLQ